MSPRYLGGRACARWACVYWWNLFAVLSVQRAHTPVLLRLTWLTCKKKKGKKIAQLSRAECLYLATGVSCPRLLLPLFGTDHLSETLTQGGKCGECVRVTAGSSPEDSHSQLFLINTQILTDKWAAPEGFRRFVQFKPANAWRSSSSHRAARFSLCQSYITAQGL